MDDRDMKNVLHGIWLCIHRNAIRATTKERISQFRDSFIDTIENLPCSNCKNHALEYLRSHPMRENCHVLFYYFTWTWEFHNAVNRRIGKREMHWQEAYDRYADGDPYICSKECGNDKKNNRF